MRAIEAKTFSGYGGLRQTGLPKPQSAKDRVLVRVTAAGVTPLEYTVLSGGHPRAKAPLVLGNEGAGVIEDAGGSGNRWVGRQRDLSTRAGAGRRQGDFDRRQRGESRQGERTWLRRRGRPIRRRPRRGRSPDNGRQGCRHRHRKHRW